MRQATVWAIALLIAALAADHAVGRMDVPSPHALPVAGFPRSLDGWTGSPDLPVDPQIAQALPGATILERTYTNHYGQALDLLLVTSSVPGDLHSPSQCLPAHGWDVLTSTTRGAVHELRVSQQSQSLDVIYWLGGYYRPRPAQDSFLRTLQRVREAVNKDEGASLMVRLIASNDPATSGAEHAFAAQIQEPLHSLQSKGYLDVGN